MADKKNGGDPPPLVQNKSVLVLEFSFIGSADFRIHRENVSTQQLRAAAGWLLWLADREADVNANLAEKMAQMEGRAKGIAIPVGVGVPKELKL